MIEADSLPTDRESLVRTLIPVANTLATDKLSNFIRMAWPIINPARPLVWGWHMDAICEHLEAITAGQIKKLVINVPPGHAKPVWEEHLVTLESGERRRLADIDVGDRVFDSRGDGRRVAAVHEQGVLPVLKITLHSGRQIWAEETHPFLTPRGWVEAGKLFVGEPLAVRMIEARSGAERRDEEFRLAGYFVGDGSVKANSASIFSVDPGVQEDVRVCCAALGFGVTERPDKRRPHLLKQSATNGVRPWLREIGLSGLGSHDKRVPPFVFEGDNRQVAQFVGAYFSCDGTLGTKGKARKDLYFSFCSMSIPLLRDVQSLLSRLGVLGRIRYRTTGKNNFSINDRKYGVLEVTGRDNVSRFGDLIPIHSADRAARLAEWASFRTDFDRALVPDKIVSIEPGGDLPCRCLTIEDGDSFLIEDIVTHNTSIISICWPCWEWLKNPQLRYLAASYSDDLAKRASKDRTDIIHSPWYQSLFSTVPFFKDPKNRWEVTHSTLKEIRTNKAGSMISTSIGGKATGMHGDRVLVDDPLKAQDVHTINLARHVEWFNQTMRTRVTSVKESAFVVVMQRLHQEDLAGVLIKDDEWDHLRLPSEFEPAKKTVTSIGWEDPRTEEGEPLFPERFPVEHLRHQKGPFGLGPIAYAAQHQQDPVSGEGNIFQRGWWKFWSDDPKVKADARLPDEVDRVIGSWDMTFKAGTDSDFVVGQVWAAKGADFYLLDQVRARLGFTETKHAFRSLAAEYPMVDRWLVEEKANGSAIISELKDEIGGVISVVPLETKAARAAAVSGFVEAGNVYLPSMDMTNDGGAARFPWVFQLLDECLVGSTLVATEHGDAPISDVRAGDRVWTRSGWEFVLKADCTKKAARVFSVSIGDRKLVGTAGHPVWVDGRGFVPLVELKPGDEVLCLEGSMSSSIGGSSSGGTRTDIVGVGACRLPGPGTGSQRECGPARFVGSSSTPGRRRRAVASVVTSSAVEVGIEDVYNLHVEGAEEYFANGILVHNCSVFPSGAFDDQVDAMTQALRDLKEWVRSLHNLSLPPPLPPRRGQAKRDAVAGEAPVHRLQKQAKKIIERERARMGKRGTFRASRDPNEVEGE